MTRPALMFALVLLAAPAMAAAPHKQPLPAKEPPAAAALSADDLMRQAQAAGYKEDIGPSRCSDWPAGAEWPTHANRSAGVEFGERSADGANLAYSVNETGRIGRAADADGDLPDAEGIQHIELTRLKRWP